MGRLFKHIAIYAFSLILVYILVFTLTFRMFPQPKYIDTLIAKQTIYGTFPKFVVMRQQLLSRNTKKIIILGTSTAMYGFRPKEIAPFFPGYDIHNVCVGASNVTEVVQIYNIVKNNVPKDSQKDNVYVIGIWFGLFSSDKFRIKGDLTAIDTEELRYGLYRRVNGKIIPTLKSADQFDKATTLLLPYLLIDYIRSQFVDNKSKVVFHFGKLQRRIKDHKNMGLRLPSFLFHMYKNELVALKNNSYYNNKHLTESDKNIEITYIKHYMGSNPIPDERQYDQLKTLMKHISNDGATLILIDTPIPKWHKDISPYYRAYQSHKTSIISLAKTLPKTYYVNIQDLDDNMDFIDGMHPNQNASVKWSGRLVSFMKTILKNKNEKDDFRNRSGHH